MKIRLIFLALITLGTLFRPQSSPAATGAGSNLTLGLTAGQNVAIVGDVYAYQITVTNAGAARFSSATVQDVLPTGVQYESAAGPGTYNPASGRWTFSPASTGTVSTLTIQVMALQTGAIVNTAKLIRSTPELAGWAYAIAAVTVTVGRSVPPLVLDSPANVTVTASASGSATVNFNPQASGGCSSLTITAFPPSGSTFSIGTTPVKLTASDACGDITNRSFTVTVLPPPSTPVGLAKSSSIVLTCSSNLTITASTPNGTNVYFTTSAYGGCSSPLNLSSSPPSGSTFPIGQTTVTTTASDSCGSTTNCTFTVTVNRQTYPPIVLTCSSNLTITASTANGTNVYFTTSAYGGCSSPLNLSSSPPSGSTFHIGQTTVTTTASDACGNTTNCTFTVTVNRQTYPPIVLTCSSNLTITASTPNGTNVYFTTSAYGGCSSPLNLSSSPPSGSKFPIGTTTVYTIANDSCGSVTNCSFNITVAMRSTPATALTISVVGNHLLLSWPLSYSGVVLLSSPGVPARTWNPVTNTPIMTDSAEIVVLNISNTNQFFRLGLP